MVRNALVVGQQIIQHKAVLDGAGPGLQAGDVARVAPINKLSVVITIGLALIFLKETVSARVIVGALFITAGSIMMLYK